MVDDAPEQLPLPLQVQSLGLEFLRLLRDVVERIGLKQVAYDLDVQPSLLAHMLAERQRNHLPATAVPYLIQHALDDDALEFLAGLRNRDVVKAKPLDPARELSALKDALAESLGPDLLSAITAKARRLARE